MELTKSDFNKDRNDVLAALIKRAGPRAQPSTELETKVRGAVYAEWQRSLNEHRQRRNVRWLAAAAVGALVITFGWRAIVPHAKSVEIAAIEYSRGDVRINATALADNTRTAWLHSGDEVRTNRNSGARLVLKNSANIRVAANTQLRWRAADEVELVNGSIYIDSGAQHAPLKITTRYGEVSHLGTRYRVRVSADTLSVGVRDGKVAVTNSHGQTQAETGRELTIDNMGRVSEQDVAPFGMDWSWADALAPRFDIEGRSVKEFLAWAATETGRSVQYASTKVESAAVNTVLHGSSNSFAPMEAVAAILPTTDFVASFEGERLVISVR